MSKTLFYLAAAAVVILLAIYSLRSGDTSVDVPAVPAEAIVSAGDPNPQDARPQTLAAPEAPREAATQATDDSTPEIAVDSAPPAGQSDAARSDTAPSDTSGSSGSSDTAEPDQGETDETSASAASRTAIDEDVAVAAQPNDADTSLDPAQATNNDSQRPKETEAASATAPAANDAEDSGPSRKTTVDTSPPGAVTPAAVRALVRPHPGKSVLVAFWSADCSGCETMFDWLNRVSNTYGNQGLHVIAVAQDAHRDNAMAFHRRHGPELDTIYDENRSLASTFWIQTVPSLFLLSDKGALLARFDAFDVSQTQRYNDAIRRALGE